MSWNDLYQKYGKPIAQKVSTAATNFIAGDNVFTKGLDAVSQNPASPIGEKGYFNSQVIQPYKSSITKLNSAIDHRSLGDAAGGVADAFTGIYNATPLGIAQNAAISAASSGIENYRNYRADNGAPTVNPVTAFNQNQQLSKGLGVTNPYAAGAIDLATNFATGVNPKAFYGGVKNLGNLSKTAGFLENARVIGKSAGMITKPEAKTTDLTLDFSKIGGGLQRAIAPVTNKFAEIQAMRNNPRIRTLVNAAYDTADESNFVQGRTAAGEYAVKPQVTVMGQPADSVSFDRPTEVHNFTPEGFDEAIKSNTPLHLANDPNGNMAGSRQIQATVDKETGKVLSIGANDPQLEAALSRSGRRISGNAANAMGGFMGVQQDENGNISIDPTKAALGVAGTTIARSAAGRNFKFPTNVVREVGEDVGSFLSRTMPEYKSAIEDSVLIKNKLETLIQNKLTSPLEPSEVSSLKKLVSAAEKKGTDLVGMLKPGDKADVQLEMLANHFQDPRFNLSTTPSELRAAFAQHFGDAGEVTAMKRYVSASQAEAKQIESKYKKFEGFYNRGGKPGMSPGEAVPEPLRPGTPKEERIQLNRERAAEMGDFGTKTLSGAEKAKVYGFSIPENYLSKNPVGKKFVDMINGQRENAAMYAGKLTANIDKAFTGLSKTQRELATAVAEGRTVTDDPAVMKAVEAWKTVASQIAGHATDSALEISHMGQKTPFAPRENYVPHMLKDGVLDDAKMKEKAISNLIASGQAKTYQEAAGVLEQMKKFSKLSKNGNLERPRLADLPAEFYHQDLQKVAQNYIKGATNRLTQVDSYGKNADKAYQLIEEGRRAGLDPQYMEQLFKDTTQGRELAKGTKALLAFNRARGLDFSFITNLTQGANTATSYGTGRTLRAYTKAIVDALPNGSGFSQDLATRSGALLAEGVLSEGTAMDKFSKVIMLPFKKVEELNRVAASNAGASYVKNLSRQLMKDPESAKAIRGLERLGINHQDILERGLTADDILKGAYKASKNTQFVTDPIDIPVGWQGDIGRILTQFKSFTVRQGQFIKSEVISEAKKGNVAPLFRILTLGTLAGMAGQNARDRIQNKPEYTGASNPLETAAGAVSKALGDPVTGTAMQAYYTGKTLANPNKDAAAKFGAIAGAVAGPSASILATGSSTNPGILNAASESQKIADRNKLIDEGRYRGEQKDDPNRPYELFGARQVPFGDVAANSFLLKDYGNKGYMSQLITAIKSGDQAEADKILQDNYSEKNRASAYSQALKYASSDNSSPAVDTSVSDSGTGTSSIFGESNTSPDGSTVYDSSYGSYKKILGLNVSDNEKIKLFKKSKIDFGKYELRREGEKSNKVSEAQYSLDSTDLKDQEDLKGWLDSTDQEITRLKRSQKLLDPETEMDSIISTEKKIHSLTRNANKYLEYGGFDKPKKPKKPKKAKAAQSVQATSTRSGSGTITLSKPRRL